MNFCALLQPFREKEEVKNLFAKAYKSRKSRLLVDLIHFDLVHGVAIPDSVFEKVIDKEDYVVSLYKVMHEEHAASRFPAKYNNREALIRLYIKNKFKTKYGKEGEVDSVVVFLSRKDAIKGDSLDVYYCKYLKKDSKQWKGLILAFDRSDPTDLWPAFLERSKTIVLDEDENEVEELDKEYKLLVEANRKKRNFGNGQSGYFEWY
jgi:hypothetical protein